MSRFIAWLLLVIGALIASQVAACSCPAIAFESLVDEADTIMVARIVRTEDALAVSGRSIWVRSSGDPPPYSAASKYGLRAEFKVILPYKQTGPLPEVLRTGYGGGDCGIGLVPGSNYLILTDADGGVSVCSGSRKIGFQDAINCPIQAWLATVEQRIADHSSEIVPLGDFPSAIEEKVSDALKAGRSSFDAGCTVPPVRGPELQ